MSSPTQKFTITASTRSLIRSLNSASIVSDLAMRATDSGGPYRLLIAAEYKVVEAAKKRNGCSRLKAHTGYTGETLYCKIMSRLIARER